MILHEFHLLRPEGAALLLKTLEEPPPSTVFVVLADFIPTELATISSRCVRIEFRAILDELVVEHLMSEGIEGDAAREVAASARGDLTRAVVLAGDPALAERRHAFADAPHRIDGTGATVIRLAADLLDRIDAAAAPLAARQAVELASLEERVAATGERGAGRRLLDERHKRELRRHRTDELRSGLAVLAASYRDALVEGSLARPAAAADAVRRIHEAIEALERNPNEQLLVQSLLWALPVLSEH
jgi:DNA polymerase-3 subunit delta'